MSEPFIGEIKMVGFNYAPRNYAKCDGAIIAISQNSALYSLLATQFGGDGRTTFGLPDFRGRTPMSQGTGPGLTTRIMGQKNGSEYNTLQLAQMPNHAHPIVDTETKITGTLSISIPASSDNATETTPIGNVPAIGISASRATPLYATEATGKMKAFEAKLDTTAELKTNTQNTGGNTAVNNVQPYQVVNFIIALQGLYPPRP
ncbi:tail fiber protein [Shewanella gelidimarina]|uniref:phage tail protein n=1 Tax=Shewanella gelidimarina TaxID=56813 RepID=UPI00200E4DC6|nr:tail fiber protein [Shewanella gelidimarina]MCL1059491.1 tail fiber protein [Shewanella gelidimarina]